MNSNVATFFFEEAKMNYITTIKLAFLAQGMLRKKHQPKNSIRNNLQGLPMLKPTTRKQKQE
jgi:hypothetical protein